MNEVEVKHLICQCSGHLQVPTSCPPLLKEHVNQCWAFNPEDRPTFNILLDVIEGQLIFKEELQSQICSLIISNNENISKSGYANVQVVPSTSLSGN